MHDSDDILVLKAQRGDRVAFEELVRRTSRLVYARLYLETGDTHQAEDLLQETLLTAYRSIGQVTQPDRFRGWLLQIAQNLTVNAARRDSRKKRTPVPEILKLRQNAITVSCPDEQVEEDELRQQVLAVLRAMPEEYRLPLTLRYLVGADYETIQMQMGISKGSVRGLIHRGMQRMRSELHKVLGDAYPQCAAT